MIKLVAADMDGTLLNSKGEVTAKTQKMIKRFQSNGGIFAVSTGRDYRMSFEPLEKAGIKCHFICASGAVLHGPDGKIENEIIFDKGTCQKIEDLMTEAEAYMEVFTSEGRMTTAKREAAEKYFYEEWLDTQVKGKILADYEKAEYFAHKILNMTRFSMTTEKIFQAGIKVYKICTAMLDKKKLEDLKQQCRNLEGVIVEASFCYNAELTIKGAQKGPAVASFAEDFGIRKDEIMVLGDSDNDRSMIGMDFGYTVAMANATKEIKALAKYITCSNDEDGVAHAMEKYIC